MTILIKGKAIMEVQNILSDFVKNSKNILGDSFDKAILYGSYARGDNRPNSDVDLLLLTSLNNKQIEDVQNEIFDLSFDYQMDYGIDISTLIVNKDHFEYWENALPFYMNIKKEGIDINV